MSRCGLRRWRGVTTSSDCACIMPWLYVTQMYNFSALAFQRKQLNVLMYSDLSQMTYGIRKFHTFYVKLEKEKHPYICCTFCTLLGVREIIQIIFEVFVFECHIVVFIINICSNEFTSVLLFPRHVLLFTLKNRRTCCPSLHILLTSRCIFSLQSRHVKSNFSSVICL